MSHLPERKEKVCLNCQASIHGRFCHVCGQENIEPKESFWHLVTHFAYDITHFDGKFFSTLRYLLFKPGYLSKEYLRGRRADYLHPIRMYVFTSAFFFLIFFMVNKSEDIIRVNTTDIEAAGVMKNLEKQKAKAVEKLRNTPKSSLKQTALQMTVAGIDSNIALLKRDTTAKDRITKSDNGFTVFSGGKRDSLYKNVDIYDSIQKTLPDAEKDNFLERRFTRQSIYLKQKYKNDGTAIRKAILDKFQHMFPQMLFASLPLFALMLLLLYIRRSSFFYVNHIVFSIHLYCGIFIIILASMAVEGIFSLFNYDEPEFLKALFGIAGFFYLYKAMRNFYQQRRAKTVLKYGLVLFMSLFLMIILFTIFFVFSAMAI